MAEEAACWAAWTTKNVRSGPGGVLTAEGAKLTGDLSVHTTWTGTEAILTVQYTDALDWFTLQGSPKAVTEELVARDLHQAAVNAVKAGGGAALD
ncbi:hypothetical protein OG455_03140 [Kitasatospora sp. NBC_01287]|uniref:hypothetical protein n=1 Tax=unclassified Kitasatospora TaxID=2633591 RepID=UPI002254FEA4|nr:MULTISPECIES: hypothetical protein [unclassified Kitasatospora]MCX4744523.1 hypothetical protein [Kitasatospora sp. NBC_01287]